MRRLDGKRGVEPPPGNGLEKQGNPLGVPLRVLQVFHQLLQGAAVRVEPGGVSALRRIAQGQQGDGLGAGHFGEGLQELFRVEHAHVGSPQSQVRRLEHHLGGGDGGVDFPVVLAVVLPLPGDGGVVGHGQDDGGIEVGPGTGVGLCQGLGALEDEDSLGLVVVGGGGVPPGLQDEVQLFLFHGAGIELAQGVPRGGEGLEVHRCYLFLMKW